MSDDTPAASASRPRRERSTRYPGVPLDDCVELCKFIESRGLDGLTAADIATSLGYKNIKTNTFSARLSATRQFGLLELTGDGYALTSLAKSILHPVDPADINKYYRTALREPPVYSDLIERLEGKRVPDTEILGNVLYHNHQIIATAKEAAAQAFLDSAKFAGALGEDLILRVNSVPPTPPVVTQAVQAPTVDEVRTAASAHPPSSGVRIDLRLWDEDEGKLIRVRAPESISPASYDRLLQALRLHLRIEDQPVSDEISD
jgi:hypothetical protein